MNEHDFVMWLNGFCELTTEPPTSEQWKSIKEHLQTVFNKITPPVPGNIDSILKNPPFKYGEYKIPELIC